MCYGAELLADFERKARKLHKCAECRRVIKHGEKYRDARLTYEGTVYQVKTCARCTRLIKLVQKKYPDNWDPSNDCPAIGDLHEIIKEEVAQRRMRRVS